MASRGKQRTITAEFIEEVCASLREGERVDYRLPFDGRLHIDRQLPFLCVYRDPVGKRDDETERLVAGEASYLIVSSHSNQKRRTSKLVDAVADTLTAEFGAFLLFEIWAGPEVEEDETIDPEAVRPFFIVHGGGDEDEGMAAVHEALRDGLSRIKIMRKAADVAMRYCSRTIPPGVPAFLSARRMAMLNCKSVGLEVQPIYRSAERGDDFPMVLRSLHRGISRAIKRACFAFTLNETTHRPAHYQNLGASAVTRAMWDVDRKLAKIGSFDFILQVTPINTSAAWEAFKRSRFDRQPVFHYRPIPIDPAILKKQLYSINLDRIEDPTLDLLFREKRAELDRQLTMLVDRNTKNFLYGSLQLYGSVEDDLVKTATAILQRFPGRTGDDVSQGRLGAEQFLTLAREEIEKYCAILQDCHPNISLTEDVASMMVSHGQLLVNPSLHIPERRARALIEHEVGTHILTYWNAGTQPFKLLASGLAGYDEFQEGLAVLAEHLVGGLSKARLRVLAGRVVAARYLEDGASFIETFRRLEADYDFEQRTAYRITMRLYRGGGLTKDAVYLRGLISVLDYLSKGGDMESLLVGKIAATAMSTTGWRLATMATTTTTTRVCRRARRPGVETGTSTTVSRSATTGTRRMETAAPRRARRRARATPTAAGTRAEMVAPATVALTAAAVTTGKAAKPEARATAVTPVPAEAAVAAALRDQGGGAGGCCCSPRCSVAADAQPGVSHRETKPRPSPTTAAIVREPELARSVARDDDPHRPDRGARLWMCDL